MSKESKSVVLTIEEHAATMRLDPAVTAAVMEAQGWATCKKVSETVFKQAVKAFLGCPMGGV